MGSRLESNSDAVRKRIANHTFEDEEGEEYEESKFGGLGDYFRRKKIKLQNLDADIRAQSANKPAIFKGVVAHVNGYTQPSLNDLHMMIVQHGGGFLQYLDGKTTVTHIIASSLTPKKAVEFKRYRVVKPAWVVDSIAAAKLLPWNDYRVVSEGESQKLLAFDNGKIVNQENVKTRGYRDQTEASWYTSQLKGNQTTTPSSAPSSVMRPQLTRQRLPTPDDGIEDRPPSRQPEPHLRAQSAIEQPHTKKLTTPPKTSPLGPQSHSNDLLHVDDVTEGQDDSLYADPTSPDVGFAETTHLDDENEPEAGAHKLREQRALTAEEHNTILLRDPNVRKSTVVNPNFLEQYYRESRLHHLSTWKADLKSQLQAMANERSSSQKLKQKRPLGARRYILHVDFDSFFATVSLKKYPQFRDKPAVVAHGNGSGSEIASCNYPARKYGIKNGMWMKRAQELCPDLKILPYDFPAYEKASRAFYDAIIGTGGIVQSVSVDEALIDVSSLCISTGGSDGRKVSEGNIYREQAKADEISLSLRNQVKEKTDCNVSIGVGSNILLAKVALRKAKPAGQYQIKPEEVLDFIGQLQVQDLPGVAWSIGGKLEEIGIKYVKDIREFSKERLVQTLGPKTGEKLWEYSRGIDKTEVGEQVIRKSVSAEVNWGVRFENQEQADEFIGSLCGELQKRLLKEKVKGRQFTMKIMLRSADAPLDPPKHLGHGKCDTFNKSVVLGIATNSKEVLTKEALSILKGFGFSPGELRGIGIQMTKLEPMKSAIDGSLDSSQRRLQFKTPAAQPASVRKHPPAIEEDPIQDEPETPRKPKLIESSEHIAFGATELNHSTPSRRPLNTLGTQFLLPTQVDPKVLSELPEDIRSKLLRQSQQARDTSPTPFPHTPTKSRSESPSKPPFALTALPAHSQLDPDILAALPQDVRAEVMAQYAASATPHSPFRDAQSLSRRGRAGQIILPQSPRKQRIIGIPAKKSIAPPIKRGRGRPPRSDMLAKAANLGAKDKDGRTLTQANFISRKNPARQTDVNVEIQDLDPEFLNELPEDIRREVVEEFRRKKLQAMRIEVQKKERVAIAAAAAAAAATALPPTHSKVNRITLPKPAKQVFTKLKLSTEEDLRNAVRNWVMEFRKEGPYEEDVAALKRFLRGVVLRERDLGKAVRVVKWLEWVVGEMVDGAGVDRREMHGMGIERWMEAVQRVKDGVYGAGRERGFGEVCFE
ncbi:DNA repair protein [Lojkania enalia]|uniref:DNA repair protein REV1 n=1 Tax=Lojkania enalia TaxID=147567 RepID=A0A9P4KG94_9PLEO|nr:DNA repair protein [Didymosphaeria enalia]